MLNTSENGLQIKDTNGYAIPHKIIKFPAGEVSVQLDQKWVKHLDVHLVISERMGLDLTLEIVAPLFKSYDDIFVALSAANAIHHLGLNIPVNLLLKYFPSSRQDRVTQEGAPFDAQVVAQVLKTGNFNQIRTWDAHSDVLAALFNPGQFVNQSQASVLYPFLARSHAIKNPVLVSPDAGAEKKIYELAKLVKAPVILASKVRDVNTGRITSTEVPFDETLNNRNMVIVDDICDGGATFLNLGREIRRLYTPLSLTLVVTHGIFSKGMTELNKVFDDIRCANDFRSL